MLLEREFKSLILFLLNIQSVYSNFISPKQSSQFYANNNYTIEWNYPVYNDNITNIFLTHGNPFIISKYSDHRVILESEINSGQQNFNWHIPFELNNYYNPYIKEKLEEKYDCSDIPNNIRQPPVTQYGG